MKIKENMNSKSKNIDDIIQNTISNLNEVINLKTIVGDIIDIDDNKKIIPICKVNVGLIVGGGEIENNKKRLQKPFAGGSGTGFNITPVGFIYIYGDEFRYVQIQEVSIEDNLIKAINIILNKYVKKESDDNETKK